MGARLRASCGLRSAGELAEVSGDAGLHLVGGTAAVACLARGVARFFAGLGEGTGPVDAVVSCCEGLSVAVSWASAVFKFASCVDETKPMRLGAEELRLIFVGAFAGSTSRNVLRVNTDQSLGVLSNASNSGTLALA